MKKPRLVTVREYILANYNEGQDFRYNVLSCKIQVRTDEGWADVNDRFLSTVACQCAEETQCNVTPRDLLTVLQCEDIVARENPLKAYLAQLPAYDPASGIDWIGDLAKQVHVAVPEGEENQPDARAHAQQLWETCFRRWFLAMVRAWMHDGEVNHQTLILVGEQGIYKTTWLEHLLPPELRAHQCKMSSTRELNKDDRLRLAENGLIDLDEFDAMSTLEMNVLKSVMTTTEINERAAYGYTKERRVRYASFCGSGNNRQFLIDDTGNRRWLPFEVESIESPFETEKLTMYQMIYAQAVYELEHGAKCYFDKSETDALNAHNEYYRVPRNEEDLLLVYFKPAQSGDDKVKFMTASEILASLKYRGNIERMMPINKFGRLLRQKGFIPTKHGGILGYLVVETEKPDVQRMNIALELMKPKESTEDVF